MVTCNRFQDEGMRLLDGELSQEEQRRYEEHVTGCDACSKELREMGRIVNLTNELRLREPDEEFWSNYWGGVYRRLERGTGFIFLIIGLIVVASVAVYEAVTSPEFFTVKGISIAAVLLGLVVIFLSVVRERYHESKNDPYKGVKR